MRAVACLLWVFLLLAFSFSEEQGGMEGETGEASSVWVEGREGTTVELIMIGPGYVRIERRGAILRE